LKSQVQSLWKRLTSFLFLSESDWWLSALRIGLGLQVFIYTWSSRADWLELFSKNGQAFINRELTEKVLSVQSPLSPCLGWLIWVGNRLGLSDAGILWSVWACLLVAGCCLLAGFFSRSAAVIAWFLHLCAIRSEEFLSYGMDNFTTIGLFYLMLSPLPDRLCLDAHVWTFRPRDPHTLGFFRRVLQIHMCFIYFFGGIMKCSGGEWWDGTSIWRVMTSPPYNLVSPDVLIWWRYLLPVLGIFICVLETGYPFFIWSKRTRLTWLTCIIGMHLAIGLTMGLYLFALIMITLNIAAFGPPFRWKRDVGVSVVAADGPV
jgi:uncharacterized membrane protein YphA (DoxX/SURF4 family)